MPSCGAMRSMLVALAAIGCAVSAPAETARDIPLDNVEAHRRYQDAELAEGKQSMLALEYADLLEKNPDSAYAHLHYGRALNPEMDYGKVVQEFQRAIELDPDLFWAHFSLGTLYLQAQRLVAAEPELLLAEKLRPDHPETQYNLGYLYMLMGKGEESRRHAQRAVALAPQMRQAGELLQRLEGSKPSWRDANRGWPLVVGVILLAVVINFALLRRRYRKYLNENDAFTYAQRHSVRRTERHRPGARRAPEHPPDARTKPGR